MPSSRVLISFEVDVRLTSVALGEAEYDDLLDALWPQGAPDSFTADDLAARIVEQYGSTFAFVRDFGLLDEYDVEVEVQRDAKFSTATLPT